MNEVVHSPKVSIALVVKNALPLVTGTLQSLKDQTFKDFEVVVVDGASTDGTLSALHAAASELPLRIVSEPDRSLADGFAKALRRASGDIVGMLCADERYYPNTLQKVAMWFEAEPDAVMCGGKLDFIDEYDEIIDHNLTPPFSLPAHLACELVPSNLTSFFNRRLIGNDFRFDASVPTCPDYEYWARLGFRFPAAAFKRYDVSVAQAYRTRHSMSFRAESFTQFCRDKLAHLNNLLAEGYVEGDVEAVRRRAAAGIHMWAAEQLTAIEPGHPDILAHCAQAAHYDKNYERIARFIATTGNARYNVEAGIIMRSAPDRPGPLTSAIAKFQYNAPAPHWSGARILEENPLTLRTSTESWGFSLEMSVFEQSISGTINDGQYWARVDLEVVSGCVGISMFTRDQSLSGELIVRPLDGRNLAFIPLTLDRDRRASLMFRSGGHPSSVLRVYGAELLCDPDRRSTAITGIEFEA